MRPIEKRDKGVKSNKYIFPSKKERQKKERKKEKEEKRKKEKMRERKKKNAKAQALVKEKATGISKL